MFPPSALMRSSRPPPSTAGDPGSERTAYHEAGHAAAYLALGIELRSVSIQADANSAGRTIPALEDGLRFLASRAAACLAGAEAVRRWAPDRLDWKAGADGDFSDAEECILRAAGPFSLGNDYAVRIATLRFRARMVAALLVEHHWIAVEALAAELIVVRTLSGADAGRIFQQAAVRAVAWAEAMNG